ncbi:MAG TPA: prolyl oligopeptidase family serine peptidase, partial [Polyangiales bacterium]|nr:prolyl oligopeptidase family serine peptidase [Polyangiales bacterium]
MTCRLAWLTTVFLACTPSTPTRTPSYPTPPPSAADAPPVARTVDVVENLFGHEVSDPYRWMEGDDNAELNNWLRAQGDYARKQLAQLPERASLLQRIRALGLGTSAVDDLQIAGERIFYQRLDVDAQLPKLIVRDAGGERVLVDPEKLSRGEQHASINSFSPSPDGALLAYDLALGGGEISSIHVVDTVSGDALPDVIERVWGEFAAWWLPDGKGFFYTQMAEPRPGVDPMFDMQARLHVLGDAVEHDPIILGDRLAGGPPLASHEFPSVLLLPGSSWAIAAIGGAHAETRFAVAPLSAIDRSGGGATPWRMVAEYSDQIDAAWPHGDRLYMTTFKGASNKKLISVPLADPILPTAKLEVAESRDGPIVNFEIARDAIYLETMTRGLAKLWRLPWSETNKEAPQLEPIALPFDGYIAGLASDVQRDGAIFDLEGWTQPNHYFTVDANGAVSDSGIASASIADFSDVIAEEVDATSSDGTDVPLSILHSKTIAHDGKHPALLAGYGGYGASQTPSFDPARLAWIERGGVFAVCHVRGGGENGHAWQVDGTHEHKLNGVHDFEGCAQYLIDHHLSTPSRISARGRSMGGVLIGRAITERPELFAAASIGVGILNPLRILFAENGANQKSELGDPETKAGFESILEMDPYQHVVPNRSYPAMLFTVGLND